MSVSRFGLCLCSVLLLISVCTAQQQSPNIIVIVADDLGWNDVSFHGSDQIPTPNLDRLAHEGIILNNYYVQQMCTPTRAALLTGRYPIHTGLQSGVIADAQPYGLGLKEKILPQYLNELGYISHAVGKWHLGFFAKEYTPTFRGFSSHLGMLLGVGDYWDHTVEGVNKGEWGLDFRDNMTLKTDAFGQYSTEVFTNHTINLINRHNTSKPLFLYFAHQAVHRGNYADPLEAPYKHYEKLGHIKDHDRRVFGAMAVAMDDSVGEVVKTLENRGMLNNSIIVFTSDSGGPTAHFDDNVASNWPLRGMKDTLWEGGLRVPGFIWSPLLKNRGRVSYQLMHVTDWLPTILHAAGADPSNLTDLDGHDQWAALSENTDSARAETLLNIDNGGMFNFGMRVGDFKLVSPNWYTRPRFGWYPPPGLDHNSTLFFRPKTENFSKFKPLKNLDIKQEYVHDYKYKDYSLGQIVDYLEERSAKYDRNEKLVVDCGPRTPDADFNCRPGTPCLYHIPSDPCEFTNLYDQEQEVVSMLYERMLVYKSTRVRPRNVPEDPRGYPVHNHGAWGPWINLSEEPNPLEPGIDFRSKERDDFRVSVQ